MENCGEYSFFMTLKQYMSIPYGSEITCGYVVFGKSKPFILLGRKVAKMLKFIHCYSSFLYLIVEI